jgi:L-alanine-DL-glutamate epimerase-like enolase superfamily enzyme
MQVERVNIYRITLPFRGDFAISRLVMRSSTRIVVEIIANHGKVKGYGEGLPVEFVTGETPDTAVKDAAALVSGSAIPQNLRDVSQVWEFVEGLPDCKEHNAALCAIEMALLDALGKEQKRPVSEYLPRHFSTTCIHYGAVVALGDKAGIERICGTIKSLGISNLRIKMGPDFERNEMAMQTVAEVLGRDLQLRVDPNGVWDLDLAMRHLPLLARHGVKVIEEPMVRTKEGFAEFAEAVRQRGMRLMACESAPTLHEVNAILREGYYSMFNVKLCRSGGFHRTLCIIDHLRQEGIPFQIGCSVGEAGLLSAAGRTLGLTCSDAIAYDGSYDGFMLKENIIEEDVTFGPGGKAGPLGGFGLGVTVKSEKLERLSDFSCFVSL